MSLRVRRASDGSTADLLPEAQIGAGGEGRVFRVAAWPGVVAKVYHQPTAERERKIRVMVAHPPRDPGGHRALAWPLDALYEGGRFVGFVMPLLPRFEPVFTLYNPGARRVARPLTTWADLHAVARQVAEIMDAVHAIGGVVGDINESNTVVDDGMRVTLVDCDSFRIQDPLTGELFRSPVAKPEFTAPELQGRSMGDVHQTLEDDRFGLAVLLFQLLLEGTHPTEGVLAGPGEPAPYGARIAAGHLPWVPGRGPYRPKPTAVAVEVLHPALRSAFVRCFVDGHERPDARPDAARWARLLATAEAELRTCATNGQHRYGGHQTACPWCARREALGGLDPFPSQAAVEAGSHLARPPAPRRAATAARAPSPRAPQAVPRSPAPPRRSRRRYVWVVSLLVLGAGIAASALMGKRPPSAPVAEAPAAPPPVDPARVEALVAKGDATSMQEAARLLTASGRRTKKGRTGLMLVASRGHREALAAQLAAGDDPNARDKDGFTPLMLAANGGYAQAVQDLLDAGAHVDAVDDEGYTALLFAAMEGHAATVRLLLAGGADPGRATKAGWSPLISASSKGHLGTVRALLDAGAPVEHQDARGCTALMAAAHKGSEPTIALLLERGARPEIETGCGSAFEMAHEKPCPGCVRRIDDALRALNRAEMPR
ncbi:MAG: hypothetical protein AMXMBFR64_46030 [Myxococcales bacterium]